MKIVQVEDFFHPDAGYQINIISKYFARRGHEVTILTADSGHIPAHLAAFFGSEGIEEKDLTYEAQSGVRIRRLPVRGFVSGRAVFTNRIFSLIREEKPDVLFVHGNDTLIAMRTLLRLRRLGCPVIMDSHMLEMASHNRFNKIYRRVYRAVFTPIIRRNRITVIRTQDDPYVMQVLGVPKAQAPWISVGTDTLLFHPDAAAREAFRAEHGISSEAFVVLYAGKLDESKGGLLLAETVEQKLETKREVVFLVVGNTTEDAYGREVSEKLEASENRILRFPTQKYADLAPFYQAADLAVYPKQCSLSFYDAQACGLPVVFEDNRINRDRAAHGNAVTFRSEDAADFREKLTALVNADPEDYDRMRQNALAYIRASYDYAALSDAYLEEIEKAAGGAR